MPRNDTLEEIINKYLSESNKERRARFRQERKKLEVEISPDNSWIKVCVTLVIKGEANPSTPTVRSCLMCINHDGVWVHDLKTKQKVYHWSISQVKNWTLTLPKTLIVYMNGSKEAIIFKTSEVKVIDSLLTEYTQINNQSQN